MMGYVELDESHLPEWLMIVLQRDWGGLPVRQAGYPPDESKMRRYVGRHREYLVQRVQAQKYVPNHNHGGFQFNTELPLDIFCREKRCRV